MADKMMATFMEDNYGRQNDGKLWKRNVMAKYGGQFMEDNL